MTRAALPSRRPCVTTDATFQGWPMTITVGLYPSDIPGGPNAGDPGEVFADMPKGGPIAATLADHCTTVSLALQHGTPPAALAKSLGRVPTWALVDGEMVQVESPASPAGPIIAAVLGEVGE